MSENKSLVMQQENAKGTIAFQIQTAIVGITEERCREICMNMYKDNILSLQKEAQDLAYQRVKEFVDMFTEKLSRQDEQIRRQIEEQLVEPAMQEAIFKSQKCFAMSNDENHLKILTDMLIDKGTKQKLTNDSLVIDQCIDIMPKLTQKLLNILSLFVLIYKPILFMPQNLSYSQLVALFSDYLEKLSSVVLSTTSLGILRSLNCLYYTETTKMKSIADSFFLDYPQYMQYAHSFLEDITKEHLLNKKLIGTWEKAQKYNISEIGIKLGILNINNKFSLNISSYIGE